MWIGMNGDAAMAWGMKRKGHFVQIRRDVIPHGAQQEYVDVGSKWYEKVARWAMPAASRWRSPQPGWSGVTTELPRKDAVRVAKHYNKYGFHTRVILRGNGDGFTVTDEFKTKRNDDRA